MPRARVIAVEALIAVLVLPVCVVAMGVTVYGLAHLIGGPVVHHNPFEGLARSPNRFDVLAMLILSTLINPLGEELCFRGLLYNALRRRVNWILAAVLQAIAFGVLHPFDVVNATGVAVIGLILALVYEWRKTLLAPVFLHTLQNVVAMAVLMANTASYLAAPVLGVSGTAHEAGCRVTVVAPASAAELAGVRVGDVITAVDGAVVKDIGDLVRIVGGKRAGDRVTVDFLRDGSSHRVEAILRTRRELDTGRRPVPAP